MALTILKGVFMFLSLSFILGFLISSVWYGHSKLSVLVPVRRVCPAPMTTVHKWQIPQDSVFCKGCLEIINKISTYFAEPWRRNEDNHKKFISELRKIGHPRKMIVVSKANTPLNSMIIDRKRRKFKVDQTLFNVIPKTSPFSNKTFKTCSMVGNGGILLNSSCGEQIDSADFVIRCNLSPIHQYERHVGKKMDLVTANPSLFSNRFESFHSNTTLFVQQMELYANAWLLLPAFNLKRDVDFCLKVIETLKKNNGSIKPILLNRGYQKKVEKLWMKRKLKERVLSTGFLLINLALDLCDTVTLYGFWPFGFHPHKFTLISHHYYDNMKCSVVHNMPSEFEQLSELHRKGVLRIHLGECAPQHRGSQC